MKKLISIFLTIFLGACVSTDKQTYNLQENSARWLAKTKTEVQNKTLEASETLKKLIQKLHQVAQNYENLGSEINNLKKQIQAELQNTPATDSYSVREVSSEEARVKTSPEEKNPPEAFVSPEKLTTSLFLQGQQFAVNQAWPQVVNTFIKYLNQSKKTKYEEQALYYISLSYKKMNQLELGTKYYKKLLKTYPNSEYTKKVQKFYSH